MKRLPTSMEAWFVSSAPAGNSPMRWAYAVSMTPWSREEFLQSDFCDEQVDDVEAARQFAVRCWMTFGARTHCKTGWRNTTGKTRNNGPDNPAMWRRVPEAIAQVADPA